MFPLSRTFLTFAAAATLVALTTANTPALAGEVTLNSGPVAPHEPMIATIGNKRVIAFYVPGDGRCSVHVVMWNSDDMDAKTAAGFRVSLDPGQTTSVDSPDNKTLTLRCGDF